MNYYASGGQAHGLKSLAQELPKYGRYNDNMVAHISSDEAQLLKSLGGAGTINPATGLPEYGLGKLNPFKKDSVFAPVVQPIANIATKALQPIEKAVVQPINQGLVSLDKTVGKAIPGGWGTVASIAGSAMGVPTPYMVGLGSLTGSGVMKKGGNFNLQGAIMGGAMAYAGSELGEYMRGAVPPGAEAGTKSLTDVASELADPELLSAAADVGVDAAAAGGSSAGSSASRFIDPGYFDVPPTGLATSSPVPNIDPGYFDVPMPSSPSVPAPSVPAAFASPSAPAPLQVSGPGAPSTSTMDLLKSGEMSAAARNVGSNIYDAGAGAVDSAVQGTKNAFNAATSADTYKGVMDARLNDLSNTGSGIKNLFGAGDMTAKQAAQLAAKTAKSSGTLDPLLATGIGIYSGMGLAALNEQRQFLEESKEANQISQEQYNEAVQSIEDQEKIARETVAENPFSTTPDRDIPIGETYYDRSIPAETIYPKTSGAVYALGGVVGDDYSGIGPLDQGFHFAEGGAVQSYNQNNPPSGLSMLSQMLQGNVLGSMMPTKGFDFEGGGYGGGQINPYSRGLNTDFDRPAPASYPQGNAQAQIQQAGNPQPYYSSIGGNTSGSLGFMSGQSSALGSSSGQGSSNAFPLQGQYGIVKMAAGGMPPRFLSGGGDGMSDSIKANINGTQEARLADGEFVIPADVVSHLGNGSSKAGAKQLYSMMDRIRSARTGRKSQGKQINARKYMAA
jgi:hypothetical protein